MHLVMENAISIGKGPIRLERCLLVGRMHRLWENVISSFLEDTGTIRFCARNFLRILELGTVLKKDAPRYRYPVSKKTAGYPAKYVAESL